MHRTRPLGLRALTLAGATLLGACAEQGTESTSAPLTESIASPAAAPAAPSFDLATAVERARASFFAHEGRFIAGSESHRVEIDGGSIAFTPAHDTALSRLAVGARNTTPVTATSTRIEASTPFGAETAWIGRGALRTDAALGQTSTVDGALLLSRGPVVEMLRNTREGLEQSWYFAAAPEGQDDLVVHVAARGMHHVATTVSGEHFADSEGAGLGVRYGHGTFVDANGVRTAVPVAFEGGELVLRVPSDVVDGAAYPAVLDPTISAELTIDTPVTGPRGANQLQPAIAGNGTDTYLLVFTDGLFGEDDVRGARFRADGTLIDGNSFPIALVSGTNQGAPTVSWNGTQWVVAWQDGRNGVDWDVYATTVSAAGAVGAVDGVAIAATAGVNEQAPVLASAGATSLLAYVSGDETSSDVVGVRLNASGTATDAVPFVIGGGAGVQTNPTSVASASGYLVSFDDDADGTGAAVANSVRVRRVNAAGTALPDAASTLIANSAFSATVGYGGATTYLVAWTIVDAGFYAIQAGTVPVTGAITSPVGVEVTPGALNRDYLNPSLAWNGSEYLLGYVDAFYDTAMGAFTQTTIGARRLTATGAASGAAIDPTTIAGNTSQVDVAAVGSTFYLVYTDLSGEATDIRGTRISGATVSSPAGQVLSSGPNDQTGPVVGTNGTVWAVAWMDFRSSAVDAWSAILDTNGAVVGAPSLFASGVGAQAPRGIAWGGSRFLAVYDDNGDVRAVTLTPAGIASAPFAIAASTTLAELEGSVACGPATIGCLVSWTEYDPAATMIDASVRASRVDASTPIATVSAAVNVVVAADNQFDSAIAASNTGFYIVWTDARVPTDVAVRGTRFLSTPSDAGGVVIAGAAGAQADARVASDGTDFLVAFVDQRAGATENDVYIQRVNGATGALLGTNVAIATTSDAELQPAVAFSGRYLLVWTRSTGMGDVWIEGTRLATSGTVIDTTPLVITDATGNSDLPILTGSTGGRWLVTYRNLSEGPARTRARLITDDLASGAACTTASQCASGFCVDGVCCATACAGGTADCNACSIAAGAAADGTCGVIAGCGDAGVGVDAGTATTDGGGVDTDGGGVGTDGGGVGTDGGGVVTDGGGVGTDGGVRADAGGRDAGTTPVVTASCSCRVPAGGSQHAPLALAASALLGLMVLARRRR